LGDLHESEYRRTLQRGTAADVLIGLMLARVLSNAIMAAAALSLADYLAEDRKSVDISLSKQLRTLHLCFDW